MRKRLPTRVSISDAIDYHAKAGHPLDCLLSFLSTDRLALASKRLALTLYKLTISMPRLVAHFTRLVILPLKKTLSRQMVNVKYL